MVGVQIKDISKLFQDTLPKRLGKYLHIFPGDKIGRNESSDRMFCNFHGAKR